MTKLEYRTLLVQSALGSAHEREGFENQLNELGADGWDLGGVVPIQSGSLLILRRPWKDQQASRIW